MSFQPKLGVDVVRESFFGPFILERQFSKDILRSPFLGHEWNSHFFFGNSPTG